MKRIAWIVMFCMASLVGQAETLRGLVLDAETGEELIGVVVVLTGAKQQNCVTGLDGSFYFPSVEMQRQSRLQCRLVGYMEYNEPLSSEAMKTGVMIVRMNGSTSQLSEVVVTANKMNNSESSARLIEKNSLNVRNIVSARAIELSPDLTVANVVQRVSGVTIERNNSGDGQYALLRGMDKRYTYTTVNGVKIPSPDNKNRFVPLDIFPADMLERLEVTKALTAQNEGDGVGGAVDMVMKTAPSTMQLTANLSTGYNALFFNRDFQYYPLGQMAKQSPYELYGDRYKARERDFNPNLLEVKAKRPEPNIIGGASYGDRFFGNRFGVMAAINYQRISRGSNSLFFTSSLSPSDDKNLPELDKMRDRSYSELQTRLGAHAVLDYQFSPDHKVQLYTGYVDLSAQQVRDQQTIGLTYNYEPQNGKFNKNYETRLRYSHQSIWANILKGAHHFMDEQLKVDWSVVYSNAFNERPDNSTISTASSVVNHVEGPISAGYYNNIQRRWEHNSDTDLAGYLNAKYGFFIGDGLAELSAGAAYRDKQRTSFFNEYTLTPKKGDQTTFVKGSDWTNYHEIPFVVYNPSGSLGNPLNYDATERIMAEYLQARYSIMGFQFLLGLRAEHTDQGYRLRFPSEGVKGDDSQIYTDLLPSVHLKYALNKVQNLRASYYKAINRPSFFEIVPFNDITEDYAEKGNPDLRRAQTHNFDLRYEWFPKSSEQVMAGVFYKRIIDPIEKAIVVEGQNTFLRPMNLGTADNMGFEIDVTKYFNRFGFKANYTFTHSLIEETKMERYYNEAGQVAVRNVERSRPLNGQAAHVANLSLLYKDTQNGWDAQLALSYTSDRLDMVSLFVDDDLWQAAFFQLDASVEKRFKNGIALFGKASNLLNSPMVLYLKRYNAYNERVAQSEMYNGGTLIRRDHYGQNIQIGIKYKF